MYDQHFQGLVDSGNPTGEVVAVSEFIITIRGLAPIGINALVLFENGSQGLVREISHDYVTVLNLNRLEIKVGQAVVIQSRELVTGVGKGLLGRVISALGKPLDGAGTPAINETWPVFNSAPKLSERETLDQQLETGVGLVDTLFPVVLGQRIAVLGDSRTGKTSLLLQITKNQIHKNKIVVLVMIAKRPQEIEAVIEELTNSGALNHTIVVATSIFDSLVESYLAPYIGCAIAEYLWYSGDDVIILYDDLSNHAQVHREISLVAGANPGRDSYPGDIFFRHSSLLERAGKVSTNGKTLTAIPVVLTPNNDITAYLPTNIISITDGQIIFDADVFREGMRPAINIGLSVSRVGGRAQTDHQKQIGSQIFKCLNSYHAAQEFSHFASEMALEAQNNLSRGERLLMGLRQNANELYPLSAQQLLLDVVLQADPSLNLNISSLKQWLREQNLDLNQPINQPEEYKKLLADTINKHKIETKK